MTELARGVAAMAARYFGWLVGIGAIVLALWASWYNGRITSIVERRLGTAARAKRSYVPLAGSVRKGPDDALVTVVVFGDFHCGYCRKAANVRRLMLGRYGRHLRWVYKHFGARRAAYAAEYARGKKRFFQLADRFFSAPLRRGDVERHVARAGLSVDGLRVALRRKTFDKRVRADTELGRKLGVRGTPSFFINGRRIDGHWPAPYFDLVVRQEMAWARAALAAGVKRAALYRRISHGYKPGGAKKAASKARASR